MTESEKKIRAWRNERRNHCMFPTQQSYDSQRSFVENIKNQFRSGQICAGQARVLLIHYGGYGEQGAAKVVRRWQDDTANRHE